MSQSDKVMKEMMDVEDKKFLQIVNQPIQDPLALNLADTPGASPRGIVFLLARREAVTDLMKQDGISRRQARQAVSQTSDDAAQAEIAKKPELLTLLDSVPPPPTGKGRLATWWAAHKDGILAIAKIFFQLAMAIIPMLAVTEADDDDKVE